MTSSSLPTISSISAPKAGDEGGYIVAVGTPEEIAAVPESYTGQYLSPILLKRQPEPIAAS